MDKRRQYLFAARWFLLAMIGILLFFEGVTIYYGNGDLPFLWFAQDSGFYAFLSFYYIPIGVIFQLTGLLLFGVNLYFFVQWLVNRTMGEKLRRMRELLLENYPLDKGPRVVAIGGGTGLATLLRSIKTITSNITAVVAVTDDGGSSGILRREMGILPPGDIRDCLVALAREEVGLSDMLSYRFTQGGVWEGHNLGNILMAGLTQKAEGDFGRAVEDLSRVLAVEGRVFPVTLDDVCLCAYMEDGAIVRGETSMVSDRRTIDRVFLEPSDCRPLPGVLSAIANAEYIILGPGSLYTSIITNLLVPGIADAIKQSQATVYYICNAATQPGEMEMEKASCYVAAIEKHTGKHLIHRVLVNDALPDEAQTKVLAALGSAPVLCDRENLLSLGVEIIRGDYAAKEDPRLHDEIALAQVFAEAFRTSNFWLD